MITVNTISGTEAEGLRIQDPLVDKLFPNMTDFERARAINAYLESHMIFAVQILDASSLDEARIVVASNIERIS